MSVLLLPLVLLPLFMRAQGQGAFPLPEDPVLSEALHTIVLEAGLAGSFDVGDDGVEQISLAVIDRSGDAPVFGGVNPDNFIYPASVYKMYVAAEVLHQVLEGAYELSSPYEVAPHNAVDTELEVPSDPRPLLQPGDTATVGYLLDLMITRSDNTAANCLIDLAGRSAINALMHRYGWHGSEVTRKFLPRSDEDPGFEQVRGTETSARHAAEFLLRAATDQLVHPWVSRRLMILLGGQLDRTKLAAGIPRSAVFYHKTGWWSFWTHDVGVVADGRAQYVIALFTPVPEEEARPKLQRAAAAVHQLIRERAAAPDSGTDRPHGAASDLF